MLIFIAVMPLAIIMALLNFSANAKADQSAMAAAGKDWGYITTVDIQIEKCRETDPANADSYDRIFVLYRQETAPLLLRIDTLLNTEIARSGESRDSITNYQRPFIERAKRVTEQSFTTNPNTWLKACREMARHQKVEPTPLRERFPDEMRLIDEWR